MTYFYIHPFNPQYFFPEGFENDQVFRSFYQPYSLKGKLSWNLFCSNRIYRHFFKEEDISNYIPEEEIRNILKCQCPMAFNRGTPGREQKVTAMGKQKGEYFFAKYAETAIAVENVKNEYYVLKQLESKVDFTPATKGFYEGRQWVLLQTEILEGERLQSDKLTEEILNILFLLPETNIHVKKKARSNVQCMFGHGDFCPWNMIEQKGNVFLFDWEMAGSYPLGYDLFTFLFQTQFLLSPNTTFGEIIEKNKDFIKEYFCRFDNSNWRQYLYEFARIKAELEEGKDEVRLYKKYSELKKYA